MKKKLVKLLSKYLEFEITENEIERLIEIPPNEELGDFALPCFSFARQLRKSPVAIAEEIAKQISNEPIIGRVEAVSGYLNFFMDRKWLSTKVLKSVLEPHSSDQAIKETIVVEYCSPNTNKPLHLGHLRNMAIGESVSRILSFAGNNIIRTCIYNDRGIHICKSMLAYNDFGENTTPEEKNIKSDHFVGDFYVLFAKTAKEDNSYERKAQELLEKWESGDEETINLWKKMNEWAFTGFHKTFELFGIHFDREYYESNIYKHGRDIILKGVERGLFKKKQDGAITIDLTDKGLDEKVLLRANGTSVYIVQDIYLAHLKEEEFKYNKSIYVVGNEQEYHFKVLKEILQLIGTSESGKIHHLSYGMVELPEGKMKSREGTVVDADDLILDTSLLAEEEIRKRYQLSENEVKERALKIALAAIKFQLLKVEIGKNIIFNPKEAIRFEGDTGPYVLYSYARASSILRKSNIAMITEQWQANEYEATLLKRIDAFSDIAKLSGERLNPSLIANYVLELSQRFNEFYHECPVLRSEVAGQRLALVAAFKDICGKCLELLGIDRLEEM